MAIYAIADLHLPGGDIKPMDVFGAHWAGHFERISEDWRAKVSQEDVVLLPGDLSWAMALADAKPDLEAIGELPGKKVILIQFLWNLKNLILKLQVFLHRNKNLILFIKELSGNVNLIYL